MGHLGDPEIRETSELYFEKNRLSEKIQERLLAHFAKGQETYPDLIICPISTCRHPMGIHAEQEEIILLCPHCGYSNKIPLRPVL